MHTVPRMADLFKEFLQICLKNFSGVRHSKAGETLNNNKRSGDDRENQFLFQRLSVIMQRYNAVLFLWRQLFWLPLTTRTCNHSTDRFLTLLSTLGISTTTQQTIVENVYVWLVGQRRPVSER